MYAHGPPPRHIVGGGQWQGMDMHNNVRSSARNWYVALAFILIIIALVLAG